jgi:hypothetical protein
MSSPQDFSLLLKTQISLTQLRDDLKLFHYPDLRDQMGILSYIERSLNTVINQISERTNYESVLYYSKEEFLPDEMNEDDWESCPTIPLKKGELDEIYQILETDL